MKQYKKQFIGGDWREGRGSGISDYSPCSGELLFNFKGASQDDVDEAFQLAESAVAEWAATTSAHKVATIKSLIPAFKEIRDDIIA